MARVTRILCAADPRGSRAAVERLLAAADDAGVQAVCVVGDLGGETDAVGTYRALFGGLGKAERPAYWVPGPTDAPVAE
jgi:hypothetical protein